VLEEKLSGGLRDHPLERAEQLRVATLLVLLGGGALEVRQRLIHQPELQVQLPQLQVHSPPAGIEFEDVLVDRHGLEGEPFQCPARRDLGQEVRRLGGIVLLQVQIPQLLEEAPVALARLEELLVFLEGLVVGPLRLFAVHRHFTLRHLHQPTLPVRSCPTGPGMG
jgi:hypothetical protein